MTSLFTLLDVAVEAANQVATVVADMSVWASVAGAIGACGAALAAAYGISRIGVATTENIARQPEAAGDIRTSMILSAALIEGACLFAIVVCMLVAA